jgi:hypothetical protein
VIALPVADMAQIDEAVRLYDAVAEAGIRHFATEQLVLGQVLGRTQRLREAMGWVTHYWGNKSSFDREIGRRLAEAHAAALSPVQAAEALKKNPINLPSEVRLGKFAKLKRWLTGGTAGQTRSLIPHH